jgi:hypothetical protein
MKYIVSFFIALSLAACALPETSVHTSSPRPTIYIKGDVKGMELFVDGLKIGSATQFDGNPRMLSVEEGVHVVEIRQNGRTVHSEKTFIGNGETRIIDINAGDSVPK